jgi:hypothetical protein
MHNLFDGLTQLIQLRTEPTLDLRGDLGPKKKKNWRDQLAKKCLK